MSAAVKTPAWLTQPVSQDAAMPTWTNDFKKQQAQAFLQQGLPTKYHERWKYADLSFLSNQAFVNPVKVDVDHFQETIQQCRLRRGESILLVFVDGQFIPSYSDLNKLPQEVIACDLLQATKIHAELIRDAYTAAIDTKQYPFASLNAAMTESGLFFYMPPHCQLTAPLHLLSLVTDQDKLIVHPRHVFMLREASNLSIVEEHFSHAETMYMVNQLTSLFVGKEAKLDYCKIQHEGKFATHIANTFIQQAQNSSVKLTNFSTGALFARDDISVTLKESGADCSTAGFYRLDQDNQYIDYHIDIEHAAARTNSEMLFKGILDKKSRAVFNGRLAVEQGAQKILAYQANHNLLLSKEAEVYSKPELEIYADDVKCKHGATTGQIDEDALFFLRSRGIDKSRAMNMLLQAFADEITSRVTHAATHLRVQELLACL